MVLLLLQIDIKCFSPLLKFVFFCFFRFIQVGVDGLQTLKPHAQKSIHTADLSSNGFKETAETSGGVNLEARIVTSENNVDDETVKWIVENVKFSVKEPVSRSLTFKQ